MTTLTNEQLNRLYRHYADQSCINAEMGGTNLLIAYSYLSQMQNVLNTITNNGEMTWENEEDGLRILELLDGVNPERTMLGDIKQIEYDRAIKVHEAYHVHNRYHIFARQHDGSSVEFFTDDTAPFGVCFGGKCDVDYYWFKPVRDYIQHPVHSIYTYCGLLIVKTTGDVRYFDLSALPAVLEYTIAETYLAQ